MSKNIAAIDFETYYDDKVSIKTQGTWHYLHDPEFDAYLVSIVTSDGLEYVGHPDDAPWNDIDSHTWVSHNRSFDQAVFEHIRPGPRRTDWHCTADLSAYLGYPRALDMACEAMFGLTVSKDIRKKMKHMCWHHIPDDFRNQIKEYALNDARQCLRIWQTYGGDWPEWERKLSILTQSMTERGVHIDRARLESCVENLRRLVFAAHKAIPWSDTAPALSYKALVAECRKAGIPPPPNLDSTSESCASWEDTYGEKYPWVHAMRTKRRANTQLKKFEAIYNRIRPDGRVSFPLKYCGASTRRWSGDGGLNSQNMSREELLQKEMKFFGVSENGVDLRACIAAPPGKKIAAVDLAQIEPRVLAWLTGDKVLLNYLATGADLYEAHARSTMGYKEPTPLREHENQDIRRLAKARCVAGPTPILTNLGYMSMAELHSATISKEISGLRVWDGQHWASYETSKLMGYRPVQNFNGDWFTPDHELFTQNNQTRQAREIYQRDGVNTEIWRQTPRGDWADVWALARYVAKTILQEWSHSGACYMHKLQQRLRRRFSQPSPGSNNPMQLMRKKTGPDNKGHTNLGAEDGRPGCNPFPEMGCHDATLLQPKLPGLSPIRGAGN